MLDLKKILVPVDFSAPSRAALELAVDVAQKYGASVDVLHVWDVPAYLSPEWTLALPERKGQSIEEQVLALFRKDLAELLQSVPMPDTLRIETKFLRGEPWRKIVATALEGRYDLIIVGTHARHGFDRMLLGSVAERVVRGAPCPVLVARTRPAPAIKVDAECEATAR
jgi:nucleotide-binding universal stress UspA family protein